MSERLLAGGIGAGFALGVAVGWWLHPKPRRDADLYVAVPVAVPVAQAVEPNERAPEAVQIRRASPLAAPLRAFDSDECLSQLSAARQVAPDDDEFLHVRSYDHTTGVVARMFDAATAGDLPYDRAIVTTRDTETITQALAAMARNGCSCVRVLDADGELLGVLDVADATLFLIRRRFVGIEQPVRAALRRCVTVGPDTPLPAVVQHLKGDWNYLAVRDREECLVSQASVLRCLYQRVQEEGRDDLERMTAVECAFTEAVHSADATARAVLAHLVLNQLRSVALVVEGDIAGVLSLSDVKCLLLVQGRIDELLAMPALEFVEASRAIVGEASGRPPRPVSDVVSCRPTDTAYDVLRAMVHHDVHTVFVVGDGVVRAVTTGDLLRALL
jgi:CBS domain-containing protein